MYELTTAAECDPAEIRALVNRVFRSRRPGDMVAEFPLLYDPENRPNLHVYRTGTGPVAMVGVCYREACLGGCLVRTAFIGSVCCDEPHRGNGLATRLMGIARESALCRGASLMLISGLRGLYRRLDYVEVGAFERWTAPAAPGPSRLATFAGETGPAPLAALLRAEPVRYLRCPEDWGQVLAAGMLMNRPGELLLGEGAYAAVQKRQAAEPAGLMQVHEFAGDRGLLVRELPSAAGERGFAGVAVIARTDDAAWAIPAQAAGWRPEPVPFAGTLGIIDVPRFLAAVSPLVHERGGADVRLLPAGGDSVAELRAAAEVVRVGTARELACLVFGGASADAASAPEVPPAAAQVLPLPLPWYGFNYI